MILDTRSLGRTPSVAPRTSRRALAAGACLAWAATLAGTAHASDPQARAEAAQAYQRQHFAAALAGYEALAQQGDCDAAERAGLMLLFGQRLYGDAVPRDATRARQWLLVAARGGSAVARHLLGWRSGATFESACQVEGDPDMPAGTASVAPGGR